MSFDIRQLRYAVAAADHRSFHRAAQAVGVDPTSLSRHVRKLERVIGISLFIRSRAGVIETVAGEEFLREARALVNQATRLKHVARAAGQGRAGGMTLGFNSPVSGGNLRTTIEAWRAATPDVAIDQIEDDRAVLIAGLDSGWIDLAVLNGEVDHPGVRRAPLWVEPVLVAAAGDHPLMARKALSWSDLHEARFVFPRRDPGPDLRSMVIGRLAAPGRRPNIRFLSISRETLLSGLATSRDITVIGDGAGGPTYPNVAMKPVHDLHEQTRLGYSAYWRQDNANPAMRRFLAFVRSRYALSFEIG